MLFSAASSGSTDVAWRDTGGILEAGARLMIVEAGARWRLVQGGGWCKVEAGARLVWRVVEAEGWRGGGRAYLCDTRSRRVLRHED